MCAGPVSLGRHSARLAVLVAAIVVLPSPLTLGGARSSAQSKSEWTASVVPKAQCGPGERAESGLQGQTTLAERFSSKASEAYRCNLELVGQFEGDGADFSLATFDSCGYMATFDGVGLQRR